MLNRIDGQPHGGAAAAAENLRGFIISGDAFGRMMDFDEFGQPPLLGKPGLNLFPVAK